MSADRLELFSPLEQKVAGKMGGGVEKAKHNER